MQNLNGLASDTAPPEDVQFLEEQIDACDSQRRIVTDIHDASLIGCSIGIEAVVPSVQR
jgi:hypothetical protein